MKNKKVKVCFAASAGGHLDELLMLRPLMERYNSFIVTEKTAYKTAIDGMKCYYLLQVNRMERACVPRLIANTFYSLKIYMTERPDVIICTGVLATIPLCLLCKIFRKNWYISSPLRKLQALPEPESFCTGLPTSFMFSGRNCLSVTPGRSIRGEFIDRRSENDICDSWLSEISI